MNSSDERRTFDLASFEKLEGEELYAYMEPIVWSSNASVDTDDLKQMADNLPTYHDEYHLVYAIELGAEHLPEVFAALIPKFLSHTEQSVRLAASRALERLPERVVTTSLISAVEIALESCPESGHVKRLIDRFRGLGML